MQRLNPMNLLRNLSFTFVLSLMAFAAFAQDSTGTSTTKTSSSTTTTETWYMEPWAWIAGGVILLILLIVLFRGNSGRSDSVTYKKTVKHDDV